MEPRTASSAADGIAAAVLIQGFLDGVPFELYASDQLLQSGVERQFITIAEALDRISRGDPSLYENIASAPQVRGFRNRLVHGYDAVEPELVYRIAIESLPELVQQLEAIVATAIGLGL